MTLKNIQKEKGVAGLNVFLGVIVSLFMIGLVVMVFVIAGGRLQEAVTETDTVFASQNNTNVTSAGTLLTTCSTARGGGNARITQAMNTTNSSVTVQLGNLTTSGCTVLPTTTSSFNNTLFNLTYTFEGTTNELTVDVINDTKISLSTTTDWFDIFIVLAALVVLVLLVVVIVSAIGGAGLMGGKEGA